MGVVLRGQDETLGRTAAIKLLSPDRVSNPAARSAFQREAKAISRLKHAHIASLYEYGDDPNEPFLAMEWVEGRSLKELIDEGPLPLDRAVSLLGQMLSALDYAHSLGIIHRDIKPANLMLKEGLGEPQLIIVDFGLATTLTDSGGTTSVTGPLFGTPLYLPPEVAAGEKVDGRADLYCAALVFYEMLTAKTVFGPGTVTEIISHHLHAQRPVLSEHAPHLPVALDDVVRKALNRFPDYRYQTGKEFSEAVALALQPGAPVATESEPEVEAKPAAKPMSNVRKFLLFVCVIVILAGLSFWALIIYLMIFPDHPRTASPSPTASVSSSPTASSPVAMDSPSATASPKGPVRPNLAWQSSSNDGRYLAEGKSLLIVSGAETCQALQAATGEVVWKTTAGGRPVLFPASEPTQVLLQQPRGWISFELSTGKKLWSLDLKTPVLSGVVSDDEILYTTAGSEIVAVDPSDGSIAWKARSSAPLSAVPPAIGPSELIVATAGPQVRAFDLRTHQEAWHIKPPARPTCFALAPKGILVIGCDDGQSACVSQRAGKPLWSSPVSQATSVLNILAWTDQTIIAGAGGEIGSYDEEGNLQWMFQAGEELSGPVEYDGEIIRLTTKSAQLSGVSLSTGRDAWPSIDLAQGDKSKAVATGPLCAEEWLFQIVAGQVLAYKSGNSPPP